MQEFLNDLEIAKIESFCKDTDMYEAVKKVLFAVIYNDGVVSKDKKLNQRNGAFGLIAGAMSEGKEISDEVLGQSLRAKFEGVHTVLDGFDKLKTIKNKNIKIEDVINEAI